MIATKGTDLHKVNILNYYLQFCIYFLLDNQQLCYTIKGDYLDYNKERKRERVVTMFCFYIVLLYFT